MSNNIIICVISEIKVIRSRCAVCVPAFAPDGSQSVAIDRWIVADNPLPNGVNPADVAAHFAAAAPFGVGTPVTVLAMDARSVWQAIRDARDAHGCKIWTGSDPYKFRLFAVRTETEAHALVIADGSPSLMPAHRDDAAAAAHAAAVAAERGKPAASDQAAALYLDCVAKALKDPAVMMPLFDCVNLRPFDTMRDAFMRRPYVQDAVKKIGGMR